MKINILSGLFFIATWSVYAQESVIDSLFPKSLDEVIIIGKKTEVYKKQAKSLGSLESFLEKSEKAGMIKRGAYAWEPTVNGMLTERTVVTIDGMHIFGACTDKMDPITSYVEISNLAEATIHSGQHGAMHGNTIGGAIDLKTHNYESQQQGWDAILHSGYESNNKQKIAGAAIGYSDSLFFTHANFMFRDAENYKAGGGKIIPFSTFTKYNFSGTAGYRLSPLELLKTSVIYDKAIDVGYPALPMDVSLAQALITSLHYEKSFISNRIQHWESKLYYNTIVHKMDDTGRPFVPIHMDMPGSSTTYGAYTKLKAAAGPHHITANWNGYYNRSVAEMTMYPANPEENSMFMYTWPHVNTIYNNLFIEDTYTINCHENLTLSGALGIHLNKVNSDFGLQSLQIFYPDMSSHNNRLLKSIAVSYLSHKNEWLYNIGIGYGERAPSISEGYGFYLYNSYDSYDYIGNPYLHNEQSKEINTSISWNRDSWTSKLSASYFYISNYILGIPVANILPMTIGAQGVKQYVALPYAQTGNIRYSISLPLHPAVKGEAALYYYWGQDNTGAPLPFMSPIGCSASLSYVNKAFTSELSFSGNTVQNRYNTALGERETAGYALLHAAAGYTFGWGNTVLRLKTGIENLLDTYYTTYADWNKLPRQGRNVYVHLSYSL